jgi:hypothetical protein
MTLIQLRLSDLGRLVFLMLAIEVAALAIIAAVLVLMLYIVIRGTVRVISDTLH